MSIYTRGGDAGNTSLIGDTKSPKDSPIFEVLGTLDEFNATLGILIADIAFSKEATDFLIGVQRDLFKIGSLLANPKSKKSHFMWLKKRIITIERYIDDLDKILPKLENFVLPGGSSGSAKIHLSRTVCRRLERGMVTHLKVVETGKEQVIPYINRLSDLLFVLARYLNFNENVEDVIWDNSNE
jgi:cob(I)alamin adenosyltransferase